MTGDSTGTSSLSDGASAPVDSDLMARVHASLAAKLPEFRLESIEWMAGGHSGVTLAVRGTTESASTLRMVVKAAPPGRPAKGRHDVLRQARIMRALKDVNGVPVPGILFADDEDPPLFGMAWSTGHTYEPFIDPSPGIVDPGLIDRRARRAAGALAALHSVRPSAVGLGGESTLSLENEIARWSQTMQRVSSNLRWGADDLERELRRCMPSGLAPCIVHGDFRLGNLLFDGEELQAIIDWEIWALADSRIDIGWFLTLLDNSIFADLGRDVRGMPQPATVLAEYEKQRPGLEGVEWFLALAAFKMAAIFGQNIERHRKGRYHDPWQERLVPIVPMLIEYGRGQLRNGATL
ncbi:MAG: phosphotransferase family protein [Actinomycetota bacterium]